LNILLITLDQFRGDCLGVAGHPIVKTPNLDRLAAQGVRLARHYSQAAPCGPGRASLYTGMYQMNHRVVANGTPLDARFDNIAHAARRAGYAPTLFGYTDQAVDPRETDGPDDPRFATYEEVLPGFEVGCTLKPTDGSAWFAWLRGLGYAVTDDWETMVGGEPDRPAEHSLSAFLTDRLVDWVKTQDRPWFAHLSQLRPHPPYAAAGRFATMYAPDDMPAPIAADPRHTLHERLLAIPGFAAPHDAAKVRALTAQYFGMISEVDHQLGRLWAALEAAGAWDDTVIVVTSDHGEMLGDHGLIGKLAWFESSYHVLGVVRDPRAPAVHGAVVDRFTENVDIMPTLCEAMGLEVPAQCDGAPLTPFLRAEAPPWWRDAAHWEFDWRAAQLRGGPHPWPWDRRLETRSLAVARDATTGYVHFADGTCLCVDLAADPTWRTPVTDPAVVLEQAQRMLTWRAQNADRTLTGMIIDNGVVGRWPAMPAGWGEAGRSQSKGLDS